MSLPDVEYRIVRTHPDRPDYAAPLNYLPGYRPLDLAALYKDLWYLQTVDHVYRYHMETRSYSTDWIPFDVPS